MDAPRPPPRREREAGDGEDADDDKSPAKGNGAEPASAETSVGSDGGASVEFSTASADPSHLGCCGAPLRLADTLLAADAARAWPRLPILLAPAALALTAAGLALPALRFGVSETISSDVPVATNATWSFASLGAAAVPVGVPGEDAAVGVLLAAFYYTCCVAIPLLVGVLLCAAALLPRDYRLRPLAAANALSPWSCIDLNLLAVAVVASEYTGLVDSLIAGMLACESGQAKVAPFGEVLEGTWILLVGVVLSWAAQAVATYNLRRNARAPHVV